MITLRPTLPRDIDAIERIAQDEPLFSEEEATTVAEMLQDYFTRPDHNGYFFLSAEDERGVQGFACYGPTPLTRGTYDLYWIAVDASARGQGIGRDLIRAVEAIIRRERGRLLLVETSGREAYQPTRRFYEALGFHLSARIPDFYAPGDDLLLYTKRLDSPGPRET